MRSIIDAVGMLTGQYDEAIREAATYHFPSLDVAEREVVSEGQQANGLTPRV